jgi:hypothetical protein
MLYAQLQFVLSQRARDSTTHWHPHEVPIRLSVTAVAITPKAVDVVAHEQLAEFKNQLTSISVSKAGQQQNKTSVDFSIAQQQQKATSVCLSKDQRSFYTLCNTKHDVALCASIGTDSRIRQARLRKSVKTLWSWPSQRAIQESGMQLPEEQ